MDDVEWLMQRLGEVRCASCGRQGIGVAVSRSLTAPASARPRLRALGADDVLDAHELLRRYSGDAHGLFSAARRGGRP